VTYVLAKGVMNETQAKQYFGWVPDSKMIATYAHLISEDTDKAVLAMNGLAKQEKEAAVSAPQACRFCGELSPPKADYCIRCTNPLSLEVAMRQQQVRQQADEVLSAVLARNPAAVEKLAQALGELGVVEKVMKISM
jgi:hypothetical protein